MTPATPLPAIPPPTITAFEHSPGGGQGMTRDIRVSRALEKAGQPYRVRPVSFAALRAFFEAHADRAPG